MEDETLQNEEQNLELREKQITALVTAYYNKFDFLQNEMLSVLVDKALNIYLNTDLTIEEINEEIQDLEQKITNQKEREAKYQLQKQLIAWHNKRCCKKQATTNWWRWYVSVGKDWMTTAQVAISTSTTTHYKAQANATLTLPS